jgi:hypothetical protein
VPEAIEWDYLIEGFRPDANPIFEHPDGLHKESRGVAKDDAQARALIRQWDFSKKGAMFAGEADRAAVGLVSNGCMHMWRIEATNSRFRICGHWLEMRSQMSRLASVKSFPYRPA